MYNILLNYPLEFWSVDYFWNILKTLRQCVMFNISVALIFIYLRLPWCFFKKIFTNMSYKLNVIEL